MKDEYRPGKVSMGQLAAVRRTLETGLKKLFTVVALAAASLAAQEAEAANWKALGIASLNGINFVDSVDISSMKQKDGAVIEVWTRSEFMTALPLPSDPQKQFKSVNELTVYNCKDQTKAIQSETYFDSAGHPLRQTNVSEAHLNFSAVEADTVGELEMNFVCRMHFV
jgi:hypothetical protein